MDGILQPLGFSQIARPAIALAPHGFRVTLFSLERAADLRDATRVAGVERKLIEAGVQWRRSTFIPGGSPLTYARNVARLAWLAASALWRHRRLPRISWLRGFPAAPAGLILRMLGVPYVYDIRGFWVDQRASSGSWPRLAITAARALEALYYRLAAAAVTLTELGATDIRRGRFAKWNCAKPIVVIPTCVDYAEFVLDRHRLAEFKDRLTVGYVGSVNADYGVEASLRLFSYVAAIRPDALLICISEQSEALRKLAIDAGVSKERVRAFSVTHEQMPSLLQQIDWGLLLLKDSEFKRGSMPTKLAEFFATGVRPIHYGCNSELRAWVARTGTGFSLQSLDDDELRAAARRIATSEPDDTSLQRSRSVAEPHFGLRAGTERYASLFRTLITQ